MSQATSCGRAVPRWSTDGQPAASAAFTAALSAASACVLVPPPLSDSGASFDALFRSPAAVNSHESPSSRLWPSDDEKAPEPGGSLPKQLPASAALLSETIVLWKRVYASGVAGCSVSVGVPPLRLVKTPPPLPAAS